jgi:hypothetical protein
MQTNPLRLSFLALVASVALSCAALGGCSSAAPSPTPATVHLRLDSSAARTVRVPLTGGTITALGQDGTRFTLTIPDHALVDETEMTLTPVEAVEGLPFSRGFGGAVQLSPDGLRLFAHATLSVQPARPLLPTEQVFFGWAGEGADLHLVPSTDGVTMKLLHFSGYGIAGAAPGERRATASPSDVEAQLEQEVAVLFAEERNRQLMGDASGTAEFRRRVEAAMSRYAEEVLRPLSQLPPATCAAGTVQLNRIFAYSRTSELMGTQPPTWFAELLQDAAQGETYQRAAHRCLDEAYDRCVSARDLTGMLQAILSHERWRQLLGGEGQPDPYGTTKMEECRAQLGEGGAGRWSGTISLDFVGTDTRPSRLGETRSHVTKVHYDLDVVSTQGQGADLVLEAALRGSFDDVDEYTYEVTETVDCNDNGRIDTRIDRGNGRTVAVGSIAGKKTNVSLHFELGQTYDLSITPPKIPFTSSSIDYMFHKGACNPFNDAEHTDVHTSWGNAGGERAAARGLAPSLEADTLTGSNTEERQIDGMPTTVTLTWSLRRGS